MITGTKSSGSDFVGLNEGMKIVSEDPISENLVTESEVMDLYERDMNIPIKETEGGRYIELAHYFADGGGFGFRDEDSYVPVSTPPLIKNSQVFLKKAHMVVDMSGQAMRRVKKGNAAFLSWAKVALPNAVRRFRHHMDVALLGSGTGLYARVNAGTPATNLVVDSAFGVTGLSGVTKLFQSNDLIRAAAGATGSTLRVGTMRVLGITSATNVLTVDALSTALADDDYITIGDDNGNQFGSVAMMGLLGHIDDGAVLSVYQGITRATYPEFWRAKVFDAATAEYGGTLSEDLIVRASDDTEEYGGGTVTYLVMSKSGSRSFWKTMKGDRIINDPAGNYTGGKGELKVRVGPDRTLTLKTIRKMPDELAFGIDKSSLKRWQVGSGFHWDDTDGSIWNRTTDANGRRDAFFAVGVYEGQTGCVAPARNFKIRGLAAA